MKSATRRPGWTFVSNHAAVLLQVWRTPDITVRGIAARAGITERATYRILADLVAAGYVSRRRVGRNNFYFVHGERGRRRPEVAPVAVGKLLEALEKAES